MTTLARSLSDLRALGIFFFSILTIKRMNKGIIVVLVLLLLVGAVIAGIVVTSKSKYTKGSVGAPLVDTSSCGVNYACSITPEHGGCEGEPPCAGNTSSYKLPAIPGAPTLQLSETLPGGQIIDGPPITNCICSGYGKCVASPSGEGANCKCYAGTNLDPNYDCSKCLGGYTWVGDASGKCVAPPIVCRNGGTPKTDESGSCSCPIGFTGNDCGCSAPFGGGNIHPIPHSGEGCEDLMVCPWGAGVKLELDTTYPRPGAGGCEDPDQVKYARTNDENGCITIASESEDINCQFTTTYKTGVNSPTWTEGGGICQSGVLPIDPSQPWIIMHGGEIWSGPDCAGNTCTAAELDNYAKGDKVCREILGSSAPAPPVCDGAPLTTAAGPGCWNTLKDSGKSKIVDCSGDGNDTTCREVHKIVQEHCDQDGIGHSGKITVYERTYGAPSPDLGEGKGVCTSRPSEGEFMNTCAKGEKDKVGGMNYSIREGDWATAATGQVYIGPTMRCDFNEPDSTEVCSACK